MKKIKPELLTDYYEFTMSESFYQAGLTDKIAVFDIFFRKNPFGTGYGVMGGVDDLIDFIQSLHFDEVKINLVKAS